LRASTGGEHVAGARQPAAGVRHRSSPAVACFL